MDFLYSQSPCSYNWETIVMRIKPPDSGFGLFLIFSNFPTNIQKTINIQNGLDRWEEKIFFHLNIINPFACWGFMFPAYMPCIHPVQIVSGGFRFAHSVNKKFPADSIWSTQWTKSFPRIPFVILSDQKC